MTHDRHRLRLRELLALLTVLTLLGIPGSGLRAAPVPPRGGDLRFAHLFHRAYQTQDLRAPANVAAFAQTSDGSFWLGGFRGLSSFTGLQWIVTTPGRHALDTRDIAQIVVGEDDSLWLGMRDGRITRVNENNFQQFDSRDGLPPGQLVSLFRDRQGFWIANRDGLAAHVAGQWKPVATANTAQIAGAFADRRDAVWLLDVHGELFRRQGAGPFTSVGQLREKPGPRAVFAQTLEGSIWIASGNGGVTQVSNPDTPTPVIHRWFAESDVSSLAADRGGHLWMGGNGLHLLSAKTIQDLAISRTPRLDVFDSHDGLSGNHVYAIHEDHQGLMWISTNGGIDRFLHSEFVGFDLPRDLRGTKTLLVGQDGALWVADRQAAALIAIRDDRVDQRFDGQVFTAATRDFQGRAWFGGPEGVARIDAHTLRKFPLPADARGNDVLAMSGGPNGIWVSIANSGVYTFDGESTWMLNGNVQGLPREPPLSILARGKDLWLGYDAGLLIHVSAGVAHRLTATAAVGSGSITSLNHDGERLWLGGLNGIAIIESGRLRKVWAYDCPGFNSVVALLKTRLGGYWQYYGANLSHETEAAVRDAIANEKVRITCNTYGQSDSLPGALQIAPSQPMAETPDQRLWFAVGGKLLHKDLRDPLFRVAQPKAIIFDIAERTSGMPEQSQYEIHSPVQGMKFSPGSQFLSFRFAAWQLAAPERIRFRYRLVNVDEDWQLTHFPWHNGYNNLGPGSYVFQVTASNGGGIWSDITELHFSIRPFFHQTWWFYSLCGLLVLGIIALLFQLQLRRVSNRLRARLSERLLERERIARELHDTLLQGFQGLILRFQGVASRISADQPARGQLEGLLDEADQVLVESRDRVSELRQSPYESGELPEAIAEVAHKLGAGLGIETKMTVAGDPRDIDVGVHAETFLIAREALSNAIRHSGAKQVLVRLEYERHSLRLTIRDDGTGIDDVVLHAGGKAGHWGMQGMRERAQKLRASLLFRRLQEGGTEVELRIPASVAFSHRRKPA